MEKITEKLSNITLKNKNKNKGTGAGGKNTTLNGGSFENITSIESMLLSKGFVKKKFTTCSDYFMEKKLENENISLVYVKQWGLKTFMKENYKKSSFRKPDEAFIVIEKDKITINILEKKFQSVEGSVDIKLWAGNSLKREYEIYFGDKFVINYAFSLSKYLINKVNSKEPKWNILKIILQEHNIIIFNPDNSDYFSQIINWAFPLLKIPSTEIEIEV